MKINKEYSTAPENKIIGALVKDTKFFETIPSYWNEGYFNDWRNRVIFRTIKDKLDNGEVVVENILDDIVYNGNTNTEHIITYNSDQWDNYIMKQTMVATTEIGSSEYIKKVEAIKKEIEVKEELKSAIDKLDNKGDINDISKELFDNVDSIITESLVSPEENIGEVASFVLTKLRDSKGEVKNIKTGIEDWDLLTQGLDEGTLHIFAGRPAMGKTALIVQLAKNITDQEIPVALYSLEMPSKQIAIRMLSLLSGIDSHKFRDYNYVMENIREIAKWTNYMKTMGITIEDTGGLTIETLDWRIKDLVKRKGIKVVIIDYLQLMDTNGISNRNTSQYYGYISKKLKIISKKYKISIIALAQLNRSVEERQDKIPLMSDLRESGQIEQDADSITMLYRPSYYSRDNEVKSNPLTKLTLSLVKNREGGTYNVDTLYDLRTNSIKQHKFTEEEEMVITRDLNFLKLEGKVYKAIESAYVEGIIETRQVKSIKSDNWDGDIIELEIRDKAKDVFLVKVFDNDGKYNDKLKEKDIINAKGKYEKNSFTGGYELVSNDITIIGKENNER